MCHADAFRTNYAKMLLKMSQYKYFKNNETSNGFIIFEIFILRYFEKLCQNLSEKL